jgi:tetratricopeptide (TPR) repeat protein
MSPFHVAGASICSTRLSRQVWLVVSLALFSAICTGCQMASHTQNAEGVTMFQQAYYEGALQRFHQASQNDPNNADAYYNLGATYHRLAKLHNQKTDLQQAESYYHQCLDHNINHQDCYRGLAVLLVEEGRTQDAFQLVQNWEQRSPSLAAPKIELARLYDEGGNKSAAKQQLTEALAVDPNNARALAALGKLREDSGETAQAIANYQRSLAINRYQPQVAQRMASLQSGIGPTGLPTPPGGTRIVTQPGGTQLQ